MNQTGFAKIMARCDLSPADPAKKRMINRRTGSGPAGPSVLVAERQTTPAYVERANRYASDASRRRELRLAANVEAMARSRAQ